jgi:hypothetical protein
VLTSGPLALTRFWQRYGERYPGIKLPAKAEIYPALAGFNFSFAGTPDAIGVHLCWGSWRRKRSLQKHRNIIRRKITSFV